LSSAQEEEEEDEEEELSQLKLLTTEAESFTT
jgi:hypothetical protein